MKTMMYERFHDVQMDIQGIQKLSDDKISWMWDFCLRLLDLDDLLL